MSFLKDKLGRSAAVVAFTLGAFQALSIVGALPANAAVVTCSFTGGALNLTLSGATVISQDAAANILVGGVKTDATVAPCTTSPAANVANTTAINIAGPGGVSDETLTIDMEFATATVDYGAINWTVNFGANATTDPGDSLVVTNAASTDSLTTDWGASGIDLNGDGNLDVVLSGIESFTAIAGAGNAAGVGDTINAGGSTATGAAFPSGFAVSVGCPGCGIIGGGADDTLTGGAGNDTVTGGLGADTIAGGLGDDTLGDGGPGQGDTVDYSGSATAVTVTLNVNAVGEGLDALTGFDNVIGSAQGDSITGDGNPNVITPGAGNDTVNGGLGADTYDVSDATASVTVDLGAGTSTGGSGTDTLSSIENASGSSANDSITGSGGANVLWGNGGNDTLSGGAGDGDGADAFDGGAGIDTVDYGNNTLNTTVGLSCSPVPVVTCVLNPATGAVDGVGGNGIGAEGDIITNNTIENAILGSGDDTFTGSTFNNIVWPNGGQNSLTGGGGGIDTVNYSKGYTAGVLVNLSGGGAAGGNQDSITGFTNAVGTAFNDTLIGTDVVAATNGANLLVGAKGNDSISGNAGPDLVRSGAGNDNVRGGNGDDDLFGQGGNDNIRGGNGDDNIIGGKGKDKCIGGGGRDIVKCEKAQKSRSIRNARIARLSRI